MFHIIFNDNIGALKLAENNEFHRRTKHIDIRFHFIREVVSRKEIELNHIETKCQPADMLTKSLAGPALESCKLLLHIVQGTEQERVLDKNTLTVE